jgi:hypothetical protein
VQPPISLRGTTDRPAVALPGLDHISFRSFRSARGETVQASAAEDEQVDGLALRHERLDGRAMIERSVRSVFPDRVERKFFSARGRDDPQVGIHGREELIAARAARNVLRETRR